MTSRNYENLIEGSNTTQNEGFEMSSIRTENGFVSYGHTNHTKIYHGCCLNDCRKGFLINYLIGANFAGAFFIPFIFWLMWLVNNKNTDKPRWPSDEGWIYVGIYSASSIGLYIFKTLCFCYTKETNCYYTRE